MFDQAINIEKIPDYSMVGLFFGLLGFMSLVIVVGWINKIITAGLHTPKKRPVRGNLDTPNRKRAALVRRKSR